MDTLLLYVVLIATSLWIVFSIFFKPRIERRRDTIKRINRLIKSAENKVNKDNSEITVSDLRIAHARLLDEIEGKKVGRQITNLSNEIDYGLGKSAADLGYYVRLREEVFKLTEDLKRIALLEEANAFDSNEAEKQKIAIRTRFKKKHFDVLNIDMETAKELNQLEVISDSELKAVVIRDAKSQNDSQEEILKLKKELKKNINLLKLKLYKVNNYKD